MIFNCQTRVLKLIHIVMLHQIHNHIPMERTTKKLIFLLLTRFNEYSQYRKGFASYYRPMGIVVWGDKKQALSMDCQVLCVWVKIDIVSGVGSEATAICSRSLPNEMAIVGVD